MDWHAQRLCTDVGNYELIVEKQKQHWQCEQKRDSWKWSVIYHGAIVASGSVNSEHEAKVKAEANVPAGAQNSKGDDCGCD